MNAINVVTIGKLIAAHRESDEEKFRAYVEFIAEAYEQQGNDRAANIIRSNYTGDYGEQGKVVLDEAGEQYSTNNLVSPPLALIGETYISDESYFHKWLVAQGGNELLERASITIDVDVIYAYDNVDKVEKSSEDGEVHGVLINSTMYLRESEIKQVARLIKDEKLRNRVLTLMRSHRRIVSAPEKENRNIREIASAQMLGQG